MTSQLSPYWLAKASSGPSPVKSKVKRSRDDSFFDISHDEPMEFPVILKDGSIIGVDFCTALGFKEALEYNIIKNFSHRSNDQAFREELEKIIREVVEPKFRALLLENVQTRVLYERENRNGSGISPIKKKGRGCVPPFDSTPPSRPPFPTSGSSSNEVSFDDEKTVSTKEDLMDLGDSERDETDSSEDYDEDEEGYELDEEEEGEEGEEDSLMEIKEDE